VSHQVEDGVTLGVARVLVEVGVQVQQRVHLMHHQLEQLVVVVVGVVRGPRDVVPLVVATRGGPHEDRHPCCGHGRGGRHKGS